MKDKNKHISKDNKFVYDKLECWYKYTAETCKRKPNTQRWYIDTDGRLVEHLMCRKHFKEEVRSELI